MDVYGRTASVTVPDPMRPCPYDYGFSLGGFGIVRDRPNRSGHVLRNLG